MLIWYYGLDLSNETWATFKSKLIQKADSVHFEYLAWQLLDMSSFNAKLKELRKNDASYLVELNTKPIRMYVSEKMDLLRQVNPDLSYEATMNIVLGGLSDAVKKKLFKFRKLSRADFLALCEVEDASSSTPST